MAETPSRTIKPKTPIGLIIGAVSIGIVVLIFIFGAVHYSAKGIIDARMRGTVTAKSFTPAPEEQIIVGKGGLTKRNIKGDFEITVAVKQKDGPPKEYTVSNIDEESYKAIKVGDSYDVGPYLQP
ncbi:MAG: hypothetical protein ABI443_08230 [Chthoniobacterales bacterium]